MLKSAIERASKLAGGWPEDDVITIPIRNINAPANWPQPGKGHDESTAAAVWIKKTWPKAVG